MYSQLFDHAITFFSPLLGGFRKGYNTQHVLLNFLQTCKITLDNKELAGTTLIGLSKAFEFINHDLLIEKLSASCIGWDVLKLIKSFLLKRKRKEKEDSK